MSGAPSTWDRCPEPRSDAQLQGELHALLFAGHETTAVALAWALYHLHRDPKVLARLRDELDASASSQPEEIGKLPYLRAVCDETLRLHPIVPDVLRILREPLELDGHELSPGLGLAVASCLLHYDPELYPDPHRFDPNRFLERRFKAHEYMPFGGGHRRCIGAFFAAYEMAQVLAAILGGFELQLCEPRPLRATRRNVTMGPSSGVRMRWVGRRG